MSPQRPTFRSTRLALTSVVLVSLVYCGVPLSAHKASPREKSAAPAAGLNAAEALARLKEGNARFVVDDLAPRATYSDQRRRLVKGQEPLAVVLTCADSRVAPELIFNQQLGEVFVIRVAGNVTDPVVLGSIEYAAEHLHCPLVVVLGHSRCGAVKAAVEGGDVKGNLGDLIKRVYIGPDRAALRKEAKGSEEAVEVGVRLNVRHQVGELTTKSEVLRKLASAEQVQIAGAVYSLETGHVEWLKVAEARVAEPKAAAKP